MLTVYFFFKKNRVSTKQKNGHYLDLICRCWDAWYGSGRIAFAIQRYVRIQSQNEVMSMRDKRQQLSHIAFISPLHLDVSSGFDFLPGISWPHPSCSLPYPVTLVAIDKMGAYRSRQSQHISQLPLTEPRLSYFDFASLNYISHRDACTK